MSQQTIEQDTEGANAMGLAHHPGCECEHQDPAAPRGGRFRVQGLEGAEDLVGEIFRGRVLLEKQALV